MLSTNYSEAFVEVLAILDNTSPDEIKFIPQKFINFLKENASKTYRFSFDKTKDISELKLKTETKGILSVIYYNYFCPKDKRIEYMELLKQNQVKYDEELREKYNPNNIFKNENTVNYNTSPVKKEEVLVEYKESFFKKIINKIKAIFRR